MTSALDSRERKKNWRRLGAELFRQTPPPARAPLDARLTARMGEFIAAERIRRLVGFAPLPDEPDVTPFFRRWLAEGRFLALPRWLGGADMELHRVEDWDGQLRPGRGGILEPAADAPVFQPEAGDLIVAPGRFFSEALVRLGRGAGCYDALFRRAGSFRLGIAYDFQVVPELPADGGDEAMDAVVTPTRTLGTA